jgi:hypothetical protein
MKGYEDHQMFQNLSGYLNSDMEVVDRIYCYHLIVLDKHQDMPNIEHRHVPNTLDFVVL